MHLGGGTAVLWYSHLFNAMISPGDAWQQAVREQLERMLAHTAFSGAPRLSSLLRFIVGETLDGRGDQLKEYTLGVAVFNRGSRFDPRLDSIVRVEASKLRARLASYYDDAGANDPIVIELPRGRYAPRVAQRSRRARTAPTTDAIAVLPFANLTPEADAEYLSDGVTEEIIDRLGMIPGMRVVARTSAFQFKGKSGDVQEIGRLLGAGYLIEGSIRKQQNRFRVNARLIDAATGYRVWSHAYDEPLNDIFGVPIAIANGIAAVLSGQHAPSTALPHLQELSTEAHQLYLRGRFHRNQWTLEGFEKSVDYLERALRLSPNSSQILAALSEAETNRALLSGLVPNAKSIQHARAYAEQALAFDANCPQAHLSLGWIHQLYDWQWESAEAEFDQALALNPSFAEAWHLKGLVLAVRRRVSEAEDSFRQAIQFDPLSRVIQTHTALVPYFSGDLDQAEALIAAALSLDAQFAEPHWILGLIEERQGRYARALEELRIAIQLGGENPVILGDMAFVHTLLGDCDSARRIVTQLKNGFPRPHPAASNLARVYLGLGKPESVERVARGSVRCQGLHAALGVRRSKIRGHVEPSRIHRTAGTDLWRSSTR